MDTENKILNPKTGRYVSKTGKIGKELLKEKKNNIEKKENIENTKCSDAKIKECEKQSKICNYGPQLGNLGEIRMV